MRQGIHHGRNFSLSSFIQLICQFLVLTSFIYECNGMDSSFLDSFSFINPSVVDSKSSNGYSESARSPKNINDGPMESFRQLGLASTQSFIQRRLFNTSVALTVPLFSFTLPQRASQGSTVDLANQAIFGLFALLVTTLVFVVPVLFTGVRPTVVTGRGDNGGTQGILNHLMSSTPIFNLMGADLQHKIGLDSTKCLQKTICEAHRSPKNKHYGLLALPFQIFFPPPANETYESSRASTTNFQFAAREGKYSKQNCGDKFNCFFDILDLATYFVDWYKYSAEGFAEQ